MPSMLPSPPPSEQEQVQSTRVALALKRFENRRLLSPAQMEMIRVSLGRDLVVDAVESLYVDIQAYVLTQRLYNGTFPTWVDFDYVTTEWATWWDHLKSEDHTSPLWRWIARRWPPKQHEVKHRIRRMVVAEVTREALFPQTQISVPINDDQLGDAVIFEQVHGREATW